MATTNKRAADVPETVEDELKRVKSELAAIKQRFGLDKQEEFLKTHSNITLKEFAAMLHGRDCQPALNDLPYLQHRVYEIGIFAVFATVFRYTQYVYSARTLSVLRRTARPA